MLVVTVIGLVLNRRAQILLCVDEPLARSRGIAVDRQRLLFVVALAVVVALSIKAVGVLLISAFVVIPASAARLLARSFSGYQLLASGLGALGAVLGLLASAAFNLPSGPSVVLVQLLGFLLAVLLSACGRSGLAATAGWPGRDG
jgi:zinc/manganese transport system permease protein